MGAYNPNNATSTFFNSAYAFSQFQPIVNTDYNGKSIDPCFDIFNQKMINAINAVQVYSVQKYVGGPITTIAQKNYTTTTAWWMLCLSSGIMHPLRILLGTVLNIAYAQLIINSLDNQQNSSSRNISSVTI